MNSDRKQFRRWVGAIGVVLFGFVLVIPIFLARPALAVGTEQTALAGAQAEVTCHSAPYAPPCIGQQIKDVATILGDRIVQPTFKIALVQGLLNISQFVVNRLAYEAALIVANGGPGQGSLFYKKSALQGFKEFGLEAAGEAVADLSDALNSSLGTKFDLCLPPGAGFTLGLQIGIAQKYQPQKPRCDINEVVNNWSSFVSDAYSTVTDPDKASHAILSKFAESLQPGRNELSASVKLNIELQKEVAEKKQAEITERTTEKPAVKDVKDPVTGKTKTPAKVAENDFLDKIKKAVTGETTQLKAQDLAGFGDAMSGLALTAASTFTNTLLSQLFNKIYKGLFDVKPDSKTSFNVEAVADQGQNPEQFSKLFATTPIATGDYNALTEFVVCPPQGVANRGLNNCVMDSNFLSAISRGNSGAPLTVQEAIDQGLISGSWPLISPSDLSKNQDPLCYTYGFCYGNLVKLRKARVLPIGWELAALNNKVSKPSSLQEIINNFNSCNSFGAIDGEHPFCHLVDPNWVLKYPDTQCRATVNGEIRLTALSPGRQSVCADAPSCLGEDGSGKCVEGYGYCVREKNVWRFRGDECPAQAAGCLALTNTQTNDRQAYTINTVDFSVCGQQNAGCQWYRTNKNLSTAGTPTLTDDTYEWLVAGENYNTTGPTDRGDDWKFDKNGTSTPRVSYVVNTPVRYSYEDRLYLTRAVQSCSQNDAGCSELIAGAGGSILNLIPNPSFEIDENTDGIPDHWLPQNLAANKIMIDSSKPAARGKNVLRLINVPNNAALVQRFDLQPNQFYTLSYFFASVAAINAPGTVRMQFSGPNGTPVSYSGLSISGCTVSNVFAGEIDSSVSATSDWQRTSCTFGVPSPASQLKLMIESPGVRYDGFQLEPREVASDFVEGIHIGNAQTQYTKVAPAYLKCTGATTDSAACNTYAQMCQAQDVGCNRYTPDNGDPSVPAIANDLDACPSECVGYDTFKQEATTYDDEAFPVYFIPAKAKACTAEQVGCDSFTRLSAAQEGGERVETYTNLRACVTPAMADGSANNKTTATFFTWEGSDNAGYQLRSWTLLKSNMPDNQSMAQQLADVSLTETNIGQAPCTKWRVNGPSELICEDSVGGHLNEVAHNTVCDAHEDIFTNPNCREFFDTQGKVHYRLFSDTVTVNEECAPYRKDTSTLSDCNNSGGFWDVQTGFCRYFGLSSESKSCPAAVSGCRSYTGGTGRNSATLLSETFESGSFVGFKPYNVQGNASLLISNESIATDGHSLRVAVNNGTAGVSTTQYYLNNANANVSYDPTSDATKAATCTAFNNGAFAHKISPAGCEIDAGNNGSVECVVGPGEHSCGPLVNKLVSGKTFLLEFWAKGDGNLRVRFVGNGGAVGGVSNNLSDPFPLTADWRVYKLGPLDSSSMSAINKDSVLVFDAGPGKTFYLDNLVLKQVEENVTIVKDSWVIPSTCDSTPAGINSPQYYLGCRAYSDQMGAAHSLYRFSRLCSDKVVACQAFFQTQQSKSPYSRAYNVRCAKGTNGDLSKPTVVNQATACTVDSVEYCTIAAGRSFCTFDYDGLFGELLPRQGDFGIVYGPETVLTPSDRIVYFVNDGSKNCDSGQAGCQEMGKPKYAQDQKKVDGFESVYFINNPEQYGQTLCDNDALFCQEYGSTKDGNFYFKDPLKKTCDYRTSVEINGKKYSGWFRTGTSESCYPGYVVGGDQAGIWKNGDSSYDGWVGSCDQSQDRCTEFIDIVDTEGGLKKDGTSYYFINNDKLTEAGTASPTACKGQISQKQGCALFNNRSRSELNYNASVSYVLSTHADVLLNKAPNALVDPVSCAQLNGGVYTISDTQKALLGLEDLNPGQDGTQVPLCNTRCQYVTSSDDSILSNMGQFYQSFSDHVSYLERACLMDSDCPALQTKNGQVVKGSCTKDYVDDNYRLSNDSNTVLKVNRDRSCSAWLACDSSRTSFNAQSNKYEPICDSISLCVKGGNVGQSSACTQWDPRAPEILTNYGYSKRDVNWNGYELSGYAIPNQLPVELYDQFNVNPAKACTKNGAFVKKDGSALPASESPVACGDNTECKGGGVCQIASQDFRLVYNAGSCDSSAGNGGACRVGRCSITQNACSKNADCSGAGNTCLTGACQAVATKNCQNADCSCTSADANNNKKANACENAKTGANKDASVCDPVAGVCVDHLTTGAGAVTCGPENACVDGASCIDSATTAHGACFNNQCLTNIKDTDKNGFADPIQISSALGQSCRGYPEADSPFPSKVVDQWSTAKEKPEKGLDINTSLNQLKSWSTPYTFKTGYEDSRTCAVDAQGHITNCDCSYDKISYGKGAITRYENVGASPNATQGFCLGGPHEGLHCATDEDCSEGDKDKGTCLRLQKQDTILGWSGFCIEKDSSIQINASTDPEDRACLTWLPVDQLSGATDLYAKYTSAGFAVDQTLYCADIQPSYDVKTTAVGCGEIKGPGYCGWDHDDGVGDAKDNIGDDDPIIFCPDGFFGVMTMCDELSESGHTIANSSDGDCEEGDNDYPYFCVPYQSKKTENNQTTDCIPPTDANWQTRDNSGHPTYLYVDGGTFETKYNTYKNCVVKGISQEHISKYLFKESNPSQVSENGPGSIYYGLTYNFDQHASCKSLVETSTSKLQPAGSKNVYNVAWTDRLWKAGYTIQPDNSPEFSYRYATSPSLFGRAVPLATLTEKPDPSAPVLSMCRKGQSEKFQIRNPQNPDEFICAQQQDGYQLSAGDARGFYQVALNSTGFAPPDEKFCKDGGCACPTKKTVECNWQKNPQVQNDPGRPVTCGDRRCSNNNNVACDSEDDCPNWDPKSPQACGIGFPACPAGQNCHSQIWGNSGTCSPDCNPQGQSVCIGGPKNEEACQDDGFCRNNQCLQGECVSTQLLPGGTPLSNLEPPEKAKTRLQQLFALSLNLVTFNDGLVNNPGEAGNSTGTFSDPSSIDKGAAWYWDARSQGDITEKPTPPKVISLGACVGSKCREGKEGTFTVNDQDSGNIEGKVSKRATVSFFTYANSNQMPIRQIVVDWGDGKNFGAMPWPTDAQTGSIAKDNFYKNHRGVNASGQEICSSAPDEFGKTFDACSSSFVVFNHDYVCTHADIANKLDGRACKYASDGRLLNSPCTDGKRCIYQPRVNVQDNWGWCTGFCNAGADGTNGCFGGDEQPGQNVYNNECNIDKCPSKAEDGAQGTAPCPDKTAGTVNNPWVNFDGTVIITPEE
ncbi:hypothetical protein HZA85_00510 [Candidatus Uhrbacteria bacterium]|nr:hypothetical protein [Candidatus Uhrbacteria bacterium]